jgi:PAS domain S-box-containing protein
MSVAVAGQEQDYVRSIKIYADDRPEGHGPTGLAFRSGQPYICNDMLHNPVTGTWRAEAARRGFNASAVFPIRLKNKVCATLSVYSDEPEFFQDKEIALLTEAAGDISFALDNFANQTARRQMEIVAEGERLFSATMIESMPGILYFYNEQGRFLRWNRNFETVSGYSAAEIAGMHPLDFFPDQEKGLLQARIAEVFTAGESSVEASFVAKDGRVTPYFFTGRRAVFEGANCLVGMGVDISERKRVELELRETQGQLEAVVENLREGLVIADPKGEFLRWNPASFRMLGFTNPEEGRRQQREFLQGLAGPLTAEQSKQLGMVRGSARHLLELINDVLDLSKIEAGQLEIRAAPFLFHDSIECVVGSVRPLAEKKNLKLSVVTPPELGPITSDRRRVEQILLNLVNNAIKFTEEGGVTITVEPSADHQATPETSPRPAMRLRVSDTGIGIKPEDLAVLFQPFRQVDSGLTRKHEGTGLGLVICRRLAALLGGGISVTSEWGRGSEFVLTIPVQPPSVV